MNINILLADDHPMICEGISKICLSNHYLKLIKSVENGEQLITSYSKIIPDLIIVDISMPVLGGMEAFERIKKNHNNVRCLFYSFCGSKLEIYKLYQLGANGYICKSRGTKEIIKAIKTVAAGNLYFDENFSHKDFVKFQNSTINNKSRMEGKKLSKREADILILVAQGLTNIKIAEKLHISEKTVEVHRRNIRQKFGLIGSTELVKYAIKIVEQFNSSDKN